MIFSVCLDIDGDLLNIPHSDANCGAAYTAAEDDYLLGGIDGCTQTNTSNAAVVPTTKPVCT